MCKTWKLKLLLLMFQMYLLSQLSVESASVISYLPGFEGPLPFHLETGYIGVGEGERVKLFYYFIKSENNPEKDPLLIWLTGGPGCSSLSALAFEIGPLSLKNEGYNGGLPSLISTPYSWTKEANIIFLDQPVGTGFSYSTTPLADKPSDTGEAKQAYEFLQKWLVKYPEFASNPFYIGGDSHSGMVVPVIVQLISNGNEHSYKPLINLKGYVLGNPSTNYEAYINYRIPFAHRMGLISDELYESLKRRCKGNYVQIDPTNTQCLKLMDYYNKCVSRINEALILTPLCEFALPNPFTDIGRRDLKEFVHSNLSLPSSHCYTYRYLLATKWANDEDVRRALHVVKGSIGKWARCATDMAYDKDIKSTVPYHRSNSIKGNLRSLIYSGDHDMLVPYIGTQAWIKSLNYSIIDEWRPWLVNNQVMGYTRTYANNMTFATIKGGGHTAEYKPEESFIMFQRWIRGQPL
ncbi:hypothetical protein AALP_AA1G326200 [Arabis alpina]|uniref:Serine carboxypeptidase-like 7 n=1 Tax=Arabis alpina TaxID=50452 RepID=A0A087HS60_ARAAL|nr:hypothetical protein AALP_AA1G326200 [Arabis alpina]